MKTVEEIRQELEQAFPDRLDAVMESYKTDPRKGVARLLDTYLRRRKSQEAERQRLSSLWEYERQVWDQGLVCGIDEAGRGPLAGPVVAGAVILPRELELFGLNDSKKLSPAKREALYEEITQKALSWAVGVVGEDRIDEINILQATYEAMRQALNGLLVSPAVTLNDAVTIPGIALRQVPIIKGDAKSASIAAASILAKVTRDRMMEAYDRLYPDYGFALHKGYGTKAHMEVLHRLGPCPIHRKSFLGFLK